MSSPASMSDQLSLDVTHEIDILATLDATFAAMLEQLSTASVTADGIPLPMVLEPWPGGRWMRDLGDRNGHLWAHVQAIKHATLLEFTGPLFMSLPVICNVQFRLSEKEGRTRIAFRCSAFGRIPAEYRDGLAAGWLPVLERIRRNAEPKS